jgi:hypothetical protein
MATYLGNDGVVKVSSGAIANVRSWSLEETAATQETTTMGSTVATHVATISSWSGSCDVFWDPDDTDGQTALAVKSEVTINFQPEGATTGDTLWTGTALVTGHSKTASHDGLVEASITLQGTGALTQTTVS